MRLARTLTLLLLSSAVVAPTASAADVSATRIVVRHAAGVDARERAALRADAGVTHVRDLGLAGVEVVRAADAGSRDDALDALRADRDVVWAEPDGIVRAADVPEVTDPGFASEWGLRNLGTTGGTVDSDIDADEAWQVTEGAGVTVGVVDTGAQLDHPDLAANLVPGYNWVSGRGGNDPTDGNGHGTHVSGIIAAARNGSQVVGVAPQARVQPLRVLGDNGSGYSSDVAAAFDYAGTVGLKVVNASLGGGGYSSAFQAVVDAHPNTLYVVSAGNSADDNDGSNANYPCAYPSANILCVGASTNTDGRAYFSNWGATTVDLFAPGASILSTWLSSGAASLNGTSMASPMVAGAAALVAAANPSFGAAQIKARLLASVDPVAGFAGFSVSGGRLNAARAVGLTPDGDGVAPSAPSGAVATGGVESASVSWTGSVSSDLDHYNLYLSQDGGAYTRVQVTTGAPTSTTLTGLAGGHDYTIRIAAVDIAGSVSAHATSNTVTVSAAPAAAPAPSTPPAPATGDDAGDDDSPADDDAGEDDAVATAARATARIADAIRKATATTKAGRLTAVTLKLPVATTVKVTVKAGGKTTVRSVTVAAGTQRLSVAKLVGRSVPRGRVKVTLSAAGQQTTLSGRLR